MSRKNGSKHFLWKQEKSISVEIFFSWICSIIFFEILAIKLKIPIEEHGMFHQMIGWAINIYLFWWLSFWFLVPFLSFNGDSVKAPGILLQATCSSTSPWASARSSSRFSVVQLPGRTRPPGSSSSLQGIFIVLTSAAIPRRPWGEGFLQQPSAERLRSKQQKGETGADGENSLVLIPGQGTIWRKGNIFMEMLREVNACEYRCEIS